MAAVSCVLLCGCGLAGYAVAALAGRRWTNVFTVHYKWQAVAAAAGAVARIA